MTALPVSTTRDADVDNTAQAIATAPGLLKSLYAINRDAAVAYLHLYDAATGDVTPGTTTPKLTFGIPASGVLNLDNLDVDFAVAITMAATQEHDGAATDPTTGLVVSTVHRLD